MCLIKNKELYLVRPKIVIEVNGEKKFKILDNYVITRKKYNSYRLSHNDCSYSFYVLKNKTEIFANNYTILNTGDLVPYDIIPISTLYNKKYFTKKHLTEIVLKVLHQQRQDS